MRKRKIRVVVDTNVIISALNFGGTSSRILTLAGFKAIKLFASEHILAEVSKVLASKFNWSPARTKQAVRLLSQPAQIVRPTEHVRAVRDEDDNRILECAITVRANYLVSGDKDLLSLKQHAGTKIVPPAQFLALHKRNQPPHAKSHHPR